MRSVLVAFAVATAVLLSPVAQAGELCCLCTGCAGGPSECILPPISCDIACAQADCSGFSMPGPESCNVVPPCGGAGPQAAAPVAGMLGGGVLVALLSVVGLRRLARHRS